MPYRVVEYTPAPHQRHPGRRPAGRAPHATVYYGGRSGYGRLIPRVAHSRLVSVPPPSRYVRGQDIYSLEEEAYRLPYRTKVVHIEDLSNYGDRDRYHDYEHETDSCLDLQLYDPETRRDASNVLMRLAYGMPVPNLHYGHGGINGVALRSPSELRDVVDVRRKFVRDRNNLSSMSRIQSEIYRMAMYQEPLRKPLTGKGNLACLSFAGGRPISKRQLRYVPEDTSIRDVINFRSFYNNLRVAATLGTFYKKPVTYQPLYKSKKSLLGVKDDSDEKKPKKEVESKWVARSADVEVDYKPRAEKAIRKPEMQQSYVLPTPRKSVVEVPEEVKSFVAEPEPEVVVKISRKSIQEESPILPEVKETIRISPHPSVAEEKVKEPSPEPEVEEVFQDALESKPTASEPVVEETFEQPVESSNIVEPEVEEQIEEAPKVQESEPEIEAITSPEPVEPEPEPEIFEEAVAEIEPEVAASPPPRAESRQEDVASPTAGTDQHFVEDVVSPTTEADQHCVEDDILVNGQADVISGGEPADVEAISSPPPSKMLSDEEPEQVVEADAENAANNNFVAEEAHDEPQAETIPPDTDNILNGGAEEAEEVKDAGHDDNWWSANDDDVPKSRYKRPDEDEQDQSEEEDMIINDVKEPTAEQDKVKELLESEESEEESE